MQKNEISENASSFLTPAAVAEGAAVQQTNESNNTESNTTLKERAAKIYKQHIEIQNLKKVLKEATEEKATLEDEIKNRNEEMYKMNEKMIFLEFEKQQFDDKGKGLAQATSNQLQEL